MSVDGSASSLHDRISIQPMYPEDLEQVLAIERVSFPRPWNRSSFLSELDRPPAVCLVLRDGAMIAGYLVFWLIDIEIHMLNIAIRPEMRGKGLGLFLLKYMLDYGRETGAQKVYLEVRPSNLTAQKLYRRAGFVLSGRRKNYYAEEGEDALLMTCML
jgi:ribosomal-protein-alanine N-acetyltransferase